MDIARGKSLLELWVTTFLPDWQPTALRLLGSFLRAILKAEWSPIILSRGCENFFHTFSFVQNNKTILITLKCFV